MTPENHTHIFQMMNNSGQMTTAASTFVRLQKQAICGSSSILIARQPQEHCCEKLIYTALARSLNPPLGPSDSLDLCGPSATSAVSRVQLWVSGLE